MVGAIVAEVPMFCTDVQRICVEQMHRCSKSKSTARWQCTRSRLYGNDQTKLLDKT